VQLAGLLKTRNGISARVAAPSVHFVTAHAALVSCWPLPQRLLPVSAAGRGRRRCPKRGQGAKAPYPRIIVVLF